MKWNVRYSPIAQAWYVLWGDSLFQICQSKEEAESWLDHYEVDRGERDVEGDIPED